MSHSSVALMAGAERGAAMLIRLRLSIRTSIQKHNRLRATVGVPPVTVTVFASKTDEEDPPRTAELEALTERQPSETNRRALEDLAGGRVPEGTSLPEKGPWRWEDFVNDGGRLRTGLMPPFSTLPESLRSFVKEIRRELNVAARGVFGMLRWRFGVDNAHRPFALLGVEWSYSGNEWWDFPGSDAVRATTPTGLILGDEASTAVQELADQNMSEPAGWELFHEARSSARQHPHSALVLGIAALEVRLKELIADLVPGAAWLVENLPSPPVDKMLREYLPALPARAMFDGDVLPPPNHVLEAIRKAITRRNRAAHIAPAAFRPFEVDEILDEVQDVLYLLDFYAGYRWAREHVSPQFLHALGHAPDWWLRHLEKGGQPGADIVLRRQRE